MPYIRSKIKYVEQLRDIAAGYLSSQPEQPKWVKQGILDLGGDVLKIPVWHSNLIRCQELYAIYFKNLRMNSNPL